MVVEPQSLESLSAEQLRGALLSMLQAAAAKDKELAFKQAIIDKLTHENALLKRMKFAAQSERFNPEQKSLLEDEIEADLAAVATEIDALAQAQAPATPEKKQAKRLPLPAHLPRREIRHEPASTTCSCGCQMKRIGEDVAEKLDYVPGVFSVERHIRGKWACAQCESIQQAPVEAHVIDKGIPTTGLLAQVLVGKYADHLPLYRQEAIFGRAGLAIPRSTLAQWVGTCGVRLQPLVDALKTEVLRHRVIHADETPVAMLKPGEGKTHRAYLWAYAPGAFENIKAVVYDFCESRSGEHARRFLGHGTDKAWKGSLTCDDFSGYKALIASGVTEVGCLAHYLERGFIFTPMRDTAGSQRRWGDAQLQINPAQTTCLCIRSGLSCVFRSYGHLVLQDTAIRAHAAPCPRHPARLGRGSRRQRRYSAAVPAVDRQVSALLLHSRP